MSNRIYLYDSTLRDGAQTHGVDFSPVDKQDIALWLDQLGIDYVEAGWPGANATDDAFFSSPPTLKKSRLTAFGRTRRPNVKTKDDEGFLRVLSAPTKAVCLVGKSWDFHVEHALSTSLKENLAMVSESVAFAKSKGKEVLLDAEHFFDGFKANPKYALSIVQAAYESGARWVVLCDTNGGTLPSEVREIISKITKHIPGEHLGIHCHNDAELAVANSLAAVQAGVRQVQGTLNGVGERCGNANLISIIPTLAFKLKFELGVSEKNITKLTHFSRALDERLNRASNMYAPYVGAAAFTHKGGLHVSAVTKNPLSYEHIEPEKVGNQRRILVSDQAGKATIITRLSALGFNVKRYDDNAINALVAEIKLRESKGYSYDSADASFELLAREMLEEIPEFFTMERFRVTNERAWHKGKELPIISQAVTRLRIGKKQRLTVAEGNGPVNALDKALRKALSGTYPILKNVKLIDYKVRILSPDAGTEAGTRVLIESENAEGERWSTIGVSANVIDASYYALKDSVVFALIKNK